MGVWWAAGSTLESNMSLTGTPSFSGRGWCSHVLNVSDLFRSHICKHCQLASVAGKSSLVGFGGGTWWHGQLQGVVSALSGICSTRFHCSIRPLVQCHGCAQVEGLAHIGEILRDQFLDMLHKPPSSRTVCQHHWLHGCAHLEGFAHSGEILRDLC